MNTDTTFNWPPPFTLRQSQRARSVRLQICPQRGLQLIVPRRFNQREIPNILQQHRDWIERAWLRIQPFTAVVETPATQLNLLAVGEHWEIDYEIKDINLVTLKKMGANKLLLSGKTSCAKTVKIILQRWLNRHAKIYLIPWLEKLSKQTGLTYSHVSVRNATTRWGSCSTKKRISLNYKLLFLPPELTEHILLHELCHTVHMNHSRRFWDLLKNLNPACHELRKQLKQAQQYMPSWLE